MPSVLVQEVVKHLEALPQNLQEQGVPGDHLRQFAGTISISDLDAMSKAIEQGCEQIDLNE